MKRNGYYKIGFIILAAVLSCSGCGSVMAAAETPEAISIETTAEPAEIRLDPTPVPTAAVYENGAEVVYRMVTRYARGEEEEKTRRLEDLQLLRQTDLLSAYQWEHILAFYDEMREAEIHYDVLPDGLNKTDALCIVVMGYQLNKNGSMKPELVERLKVALASAEKYPEALILCSGGGTAENSSMSTEAGKMAEWLVKNGVDSGRIIIENKSMSTGENAKYISRKLKNYPQVREIAVVSSDYHILRASVMIQSRLLFDLLSLNEDSVRIVSNAACRTTKKDISHAKIVKSILQMSGSAEVKALIRDEDFTPAKR